MFRAEAILESLHSQLIRWVTVLPNPIEFHGHQGYEDVLREP